MRIASSPQHLLAPGNIAPKSKIFINNYTQYLLVTMGLTLKEIGILNFKEDFCERSFFIPFLYCLQNIESKIYKILRKFSYNAYQMKKLSCRYPQEQERRRRLEKEILEHEKRLEEFRKLTESFVQDK